LGFPESANAHLKAIQLEDRATMTSTGVECSPHHPIIVGLSPDPDDDSGRDKMAGNIFEALTTHHSTT